MHETFYQILGIFGFLHPIHPVVITMLIGPVMGAAFFQGLGLVFQVPSFFKTSRQLTVMGFIFWFPTVLVGIIDWYQFYGGSPEMHQIMLKSMGAGLLFITLLSTILLFKKLPHKSVIMLVMTLASAGVVSWIGFIGGEIVFAKEAKTETGLTQTTIETDGTKNLVHGDFKVQWQIQGENISFRVSNPTPGWVGIGFGTTGMMKGSHIVLGFVDEKGQAQVEDHFGNASSKHTSKTSLSRPDTLIDRGASFENGVTTIWFTLPLKTGDPQDPVLVPGVATDLILARATKAKDFKSYHGNAESGGRISLKVIL